MDYSKTESANTSEKSIKMMSISIEESSDSQLISSERKITRSQSHKNKNLWRF